MNTMMMTKITGGFCGSLLVLLLIKWAAEGVYHDHHQLEQVAYQIEVEEEDSKSAEIISVPFEELVASADVKKGAKVFGKCKACHKISDGNNGTGPHLYEIINREMASINGYNYSTAFKTMTGIWTKDELNLFLKKPSKYAPGTAMNFAGLAKETDRANLVKYLETGGD
jgi:cytochrome c